MKILAPVSSLEEAKRVAACGADEVYCGMLTERWRAAYSHLASPNRVDRRNGNLASPQELRGLVAWAHANGVKVNVALNALYSPAQQAMLRAELDGILAAGPDGLIVTDIGLLALLKRRALGQVAVHASTGLGVFNSQTVSFLKAQGVERIVLPRSLSKDEIRVLVEKNPGMAFEVFVMNGRCRNIDGFCTFQHGVSDLRASRLNRFFVSSPAGHRLQEALVASPPALRRWAMAMAGSSVCSTACALDYKVRPRHKSALGVPAFSDDALDAMYSCAGCALRDFAAWGIRVAKIVGRTFPIERKIKDVTYVRTLIDAAQKEGFSAASFHQCARDAYRRIYGRDCRQNCYYPLSAGPAAGTRI